MNPIIVFMYSGIAYIIWKVDPEMFSIGNMSVRYYGVLCFFGLMSAYMIIGWIFAKEKIPSSVFFKLYFLYLFGIVWGLRIAHCLFYEFDYYWAHPHEILLPFRISNGKLIWTGYRGLASHGAAIGLIIAVLIFHWRTKTGIIRTLDFTAITVPWASFWIRIGNLMSSEIIGKPADLPWSFVFTRVDYLPRHPAQLYEAFAYMALFIVMMWLYVKRRERIHRGFYLGLCFVGIFTFRFFVEFFKENQVSAEYYMTLNIGQWLSIPFIIAGLFLCLYQRKKSC